MLRCQHCASNNTRLPEKPASKRPREPLLGAGTRVGRDEAPEYARQHGELLAAQLLEEALLNGSEMAALRLADQHEAGLGEVRFDRPRVLGGRAPLNQLTRLERVDDPRDPAEAEA